MGLDPKKLHNRRGVYGEDVRSPYGVRMRRASVLESIRLSAQPNFIYFLPFLPMRLCPDLPDPAAEYAYAKNLDIEVVHWSLDYQLIPSLSSSELSTANIFGISKPGGDDFLNFAQGMILQDEGSRLVTRLIIDRVKLIEPTISRSKPAEKLLANTLDVFVFGLQTPRVSYTMRPDSQRKHLKVVKQSKAGDPGLWKVMNAFWSQESDLTL